MSSASVGYSSYSSWYSNRIHYTTSLVCIKQGFGADDLFGAESLATEFILWLYFHHLFLQLSRQIAGPLEGANLQPPFMAFLRAGRIMCVITLLSKQMMKNALWFLYPGVFNQCPCLPWIRSLPWTLRFFEQERTFLVCFLTHCWCCQMHNSALQMGWEKGNVVSI